MARQKFANEFTFRRFSEEGKEAEFDSLFESAVDGVERGLGGVYPIYIDGRETYSTSKIAEKSPIDGRVIGHFQDGARQHASLAIESAKRSFDKWRCTDYRERIAIFRKFADLAARSKFELAALLCIETGKTRHEAMEEVDQAIDLARYYACEFERNKGYEGKAVAKKCLGQGEEKVGVSMKPYGVFGVIAPFNFPFSIAAGISVAAMVTGNTVVFKPSCTANATMLSGLKLYKLFSDAGVPDGVFNFVTGPGGEVGGELATNAGVSGIAFTGSRLTGIGLLKRIEESGERKVFIAEMGGKNPVIVSKACNIELAASGVVSAVTGFAGQKRSALSRAYVHESVKELFISKVVGRMQQLRIGNPLKKETEMGPLINGQAFKRYNETVEAIRSSGRLLYGGKKVDTGLDGSYVEPVLAELRQNHPLMHEELFLPVLLLAPFSSFDEALAMANDSIYGIAAGLYSSNRKEIYLFLRKIESGTVSVNKFTGATTGSLAGVYSFAGWKESGLNARGGGGRFYLQQFMREQTVSLAR